MRVGEHRAGMIEELDPEIREHRQRLHRGAFLAARLQRFAAQRPIDAVRQAIGVKRGDQRHVPPRAPLRVTADEGEGVLVRLGARDRDDRVQQLIAVTFRLAREFVVDRIAVFGALGLQQSESALPDLVASALKARDDLRREPVLAAARAPIGDQLLAAGIRHL